MDDDGGIEYFQTVGMWEEYAEWLADESAQIEYWRWLDGQKRDLPQTETAL